MFDGKAYKKRVSVRIKLLSESGYSAVTDQIQVCKSNVKGVTKSKQKQTFANSLFAWSLLQMFAKGSEKVHSSHFSANRQKKFMRNSNNHIHWKNADFISATASDTAHAQERESVDRCCRFGWRFCCKEDNALWQLKVIAALTRAVLP